MKTKEKSINDIQAETVFKRTISGRRVIDACRGQSARRALGNIGPGCEIYGFTKGQFSLIHLLEAILEQTGPAHVVISTWSAAYGDIERLKFWIENGMVKSLRVIMDFSFASRKTEVCEIMRAALGDDRLRVTVCHAKFILIKVDAWRLVVRTSMNLNHNPRFENFEISDCAAMFEFMDAIVDEVWEQKDDGESFEQHPGKNRQDWRALHREKCKLNAISECRLPAVDARDLI